MNKHTMSVYLSKDTVLLLISPIILLAIAFVIVFLVIDPVPPKHLVISTGEEDSNYYLYAQKYAEAVQPDGIKLEVKASEGALDNLDLLKDPKSNIDVAFVQDGLGSRKQYPGLTSLGSMFYEPIWIFYSGKDRPVRLSQLENRTIIVGEEGGETLTMAKKMLSASGIDNTNAKLLEMDMDDEAAALRSGKADVGFFMGTPDNEIISGFLKDPKFRVMDMDQAEAIVRQLPYLHHLVLPHGTIDLAHNIPDHDVDLVAPTATLVVSNRIHPALVYPLLKAAAHVHRKSGIFEARHEFPSDKDYTFALNPDAKNYYQSGAPFWERYLPFWLAILVKRLIYLIVPVAALVIPMTRSIPKFLKWRLRSRIYQRYGELKFLENSIQDQGSREKYEECLRRLDGIEDGVNRMRLPLDLTEYVYSLRGHIQFVRDRLNNLLRTQVVASK